jgi:L-fucose isomerase-like protein
LRQRLEGRALLLEPIVVRNRSDLGTVQAATSACDALLVNLSTSGLEGEIWSWGFPVIAYSGERTPMMGLYSLPLAERRRHPHVKLALDFADVAKRVDLLSVRNRLRGSKLLILGAYRCADKLPDPELVERKLGVEYLSVSSEEFMAELERVDAANATGVAKGWVDNALSVDEPSAEEVHEGARDYLAMQQLVERLGADAVSVGCLEIMYARGRSPFCFALASLRDQGWPAGCEADAGATLTMMILDYLADRPAYMGNLVHVDPETNRIAVSHGCSPARVRGRDQEPKPYRLVHSHSIPPFSRDLEHGAGVTSYVDYGDAGQVVTLARLSADLEGIFAARGKIVECRDTICDRTTLTVEVADAREYFAKATGNHQVVIYGDYVEELRELCPLLGMELIEPLPAAR